MTLIEKLETLQRGAVVTARGEGYRCGLEDAIAVVREHEAVSRMDRFELKGKPITLQPITK